MDRGIYEDNIVMHSASCSNEYEFVCHFWVFIVITPHIFHIQSVMIHSNAAPGTIETSSVLLTWTSPADTGDVTFTFVLSTYILLNILNIIYSISQVHCCAWIFYSVHANERHSNWGERSTSYHHPLSSARAHTHTHTHTLTL